MRSFLLIMIGTLLWGCSQVKPPFLSNQPIEALIKINLELLKSQEPYVAYYANETLFSLFILHLDPKLNRMMHRGMGLIGNRQFQACIELFNEFVALDSQNSSAFNMLGVCYFNSGQIDKGLEMFKQAITLNSNNYFALFNKAIYLRRAERFDEAIALVKAVMKLNPYHTHYGLSLPYILQEMQKARAMKEPKVKRKGYDVRRLRKNREFI